MKRLLFKRVGYIVLLLCSLLVGITSCNYNSNDEEPYFCEYCASDSSFVYNLIEDTHNPAFTSVGQALDFQRACMNEYTDAEIFRTMPEKTITDVVSVCLQRGPSVTKREIIAEYKTHKDIYDNLPQPDNLPQQAPQDVTPSDSAPSTPPIYISYRYEIDTINGVPTRVLIKEEKTYEEK